MDPIFAVSYMPQVLDAVPNNDRQSAPNDYNDVGRTLLPGRKTRRRPWQASALLGGMERGKRQAGLSPARMTPVRKSSKRFTTRRSVRKNPITKSCGVSKRMPSSIARRHEAYYGPTPRLRSAGPALASGPFESDVFSTAAHGKGFARGLMLWCRQENLPLDFRELARVLPAR